MADHTVPLSSLLQLCIVLGGQAGSEKMRDWARKELHGYSGADDVPDYRHVPAALMAVITNLAGHRPMTQRIDKSDFPRQIRDMIGEKVDLEVAIFGEGIGEMEGLAGRGTDEHRLIPSWSSFIAETLNKLNSAPNSRVAEVYWSVSNASVQGVLPSSTGRQTSRRRADRGHMPHRAYFEQLKGDPETRAAASVTWSRFSYPSRTSSSSACTAVTRPSQSRYFSDPHGRSGAQPGSRSRSRG